MDNTLYQKANDLALEKFPNDRRERVYAVPSIIKGIIEYIIDLGLIFRFLNSFKMPYKIIINIIP